MKKSNIITKTVSENAQKFYDLHCLMLMDLKPLVKIKRKPNIKSTVFDIIGKINSSSKLSVGDCVIKYIDDTDSIVSVQDLLEIYLDENLDIGYVMVVLPSNDIIKIEPNIHHYDEVHYMLNENFII